MSRIPSGQDKMTVVTLSLGEQMLAIPAEMLREILDPLPLTRVPGAGPFAPCVVNVRGTVVPLANLRIALGINEASDNARQRIMVLDVTIQDEISTVAIIADAVHEVTSVDCKTIEPVPPSASAWPSDYVCGVYKGQTGFVMLPDLTAIFASQTAKSNSVH